MEVSDNWNSTVFLVSILRLAYEDVRVAQSVLIGLGSARLDLAHSHRSLLEA